MLEVVTEIIIERPLTEVVRFASDPNMANRWYNSIKLVEWKTPPPLVVGSEIAFVANFMGEIAVTYKVVELGDRHLEMQAEENGCPIVTRYEWQEVSAQATKMTLCNVSHPTGFSRILSPVKCLILKRANQKDLERLKMILESEY